MRYHVEAFTGFPIGGSGVAVTDYHVVDERGRTQSVVSQSLRRDKTVRRQEAQRRCDLLNGVRARVYVRSWRWWITCPVCRRARMKPAPIRVAA